LGQITKAFVTLGFITGIDDMFAKTLPSGVRDNMVKLNASGKLVIKEDYNTFTKIFDRIQLKLRYRCRNICRFGTMHDDEKILKRWQKEGRTNPTILYEIGNIIVNITYYAVVCFKCVIFSYYTGILCVAIQIAGFYYNMIT
jgi:hypothetical protein